MDHYIPKHDTEIIKLYNTKSIRQISNELGFTYGFVRSRLIANEVKLRPAGKGVKGFTGRMTKLDLRRAAFLYINVGMTAAQVAQYEGICPETVCNRLRQLGVKITKEPSRLTDKEFNRLMEDRVA